MAVGAAQLYNNGLLYALDGTASFPSSTKHKAVLVTSSYTPADTHDTWASVGNEVAATGGYTSGGVALNNAAGCTVAVDGSFNTVFDSGIVSWGASTTITAKYFVVYYDTGADGLTSTDKVIFYVDLNSDGGSVSSSSGTFSLDAHASLGWFYIPVQA